MKYRTKIILIIVFVLIIISFITYLIVDSRKYRCPNIDSAVNTNDEYLTTLQLRYDAENNIYIGSRQCINDSNCDFSYYINWVNRYCDINYKEEISEYIAN